MRFLETFLGSFYSAAIYRRVRAERGFMMGYAALVALFTTLMVVLFYGSIIHREFFMSHEGKTPLFDDVVHQIADQLPVMTWKDENLVTRDAAPTVIYVNAQLFGIVFTNEPLITIDTSGATTHENMQTPILLTNKEFIIKSRKETKIQSIRRIAEDAPPTILINRAVIQESAQALIDAIRDNLFTLYAMAGIFALFCFTAFTFVMRLFMLLTLGLIGKLIGVLTKSPLTYETSVRLAVVSYTPIALLDTILFLSIIFSPHRLTLLVAGSVVLFVAIRVSELRTKTVEA